MLGLSYCNGLGSGEYVSFMDKANPPVIDTADLAFVRPSQKFSIDNRNFAYLGVELGLSASYTYERYQFFVDGMVNMFNDVSGEFNQSLTVTSDAYGAGGTKSPRVSFTINAGVRYCLYNPWQAKPPKRNK
ncbi:MAG: hypothetical protein M0D57_13345 [Sphingobacteriales bacterium JAD_PAG50586_3]|nr:MAG: hypothetical protein M0D57_13345 [Sphingobacteriales bacterium JAD_PAG50586_3]